jgi:hypothetical protein
MLWALYMEKSDFIVTLGDGTASFLEHHDPITEKFCVFSKETVTVEVGYRSLEQGGLRTLAGDMPSVSSQFESTPKAQAWIANSPQVVLSFCYFAIDSESTSMVSIFCYGIFKEPQLTLD